MTEKLRSMQCFKDEAANLANDLDSNRLEVSLSGRLENGRRMRVVDSSNPEWYSNLFNAYHNGAKGKKSRSIIRRPRVLKMLLNLSEGRYRSTFVYDILVEEIKARLLEGYYVESEGFEVHPQITEEDL